MLIIKYYSISFKNFANINSKYNNHLLKSYNYISTKQNYNININTNYWILYV